MAIGQIPDTMQITLHSRTHNDKKHEYSPWNSGALHQHSSTQRIYLQMPTNIYEIADKTPQNTLKVTWQWVQPYPYESCSQSVRPSPSPWIEVTSCHDSPLTDAHNHAFKCLATNYDFVLDYCKGPKTRKKKREGNQKKRPTNTNKRIVPFTQLSIHLKITLEWLSKELKSHYFEPIREPWR